MLWNLTNIEKFCLKASQRLCEGLFVTALHVQGLWLISSRKWTTFVAFAYEDKLRHLNYYFLCASKCYIDNSAKSHDPKVDAYQRNLNECLKSTAYVFTSETIRAATGLKLSTCCSFSCDNFSDTDDIASACAVSPAFCCRFKKEAMALFLVQRLQLPLTGTGALLFKSV